MPARKPPPAPRKASGENIENWQRKTVQILLRLPPETAARLRELASDQEVPLSEYVTRLLATMAAHPEVPCGALLADLRGPFGPC